MKITSSTFAHNEDIPAKYTCEGENINPPLTFSKIPVDVKSLVLIVDDPDAPGRTFLHWLLYNIPPATLQILENSVPQGCMVGMTHFGKAGYGGPCPPTGKHRYFFRLFALDTILDLSEGASREEVEEKMSGHDIATAELTGLYEKRK